MPWCYGNDGWLKSKPPPKKKGGLQVTNCGVEVGPGPLDANFVGPAQPTTGLERLRDVQSCPAVGSGLDGGDNVRTEWRAIEIHRLVGDVQDIYSTRVA